MFGRLLTISLLLTVAPPVQAAEPVISWQECVARALAQNPQLRAARAATARSAELVTASRSGLLPQLSASASAAHTAGSAGPTTSTGSATTTAAMIAPAWPTASASWAAPWYSYEQYALGLSLRQSLIAPLKVGPLIAQRQAEREVATAEELRQGAALAYDLRLAYYGAWYAQEVQTLSVRVRDRRRENVRLVTLRFEGGRENKGSLLRSQASLAQGEFDGRTADRALNLAHAQLGRVLGAAGPVAGRVALNFNLPALAAPPPGTVAAESTPGVMMARAQVAAAEQGAQLARSAHLPDVALSAGLTRLGSAFPPAGNQLNVALTVSVPLYSGGRLTAEERAAVLAKGQAEADLQSTRQGALFDLASAQRDLADAADRAGLAETMVKAAELQTEILRGQYALGLASFQEWDLVESSLVDSERALLDSRRLALQARAQLLKAQGRTLVEDASL